MVILAIMIVVTMIYGWKVTFPSNEGGPISLSTSPNPLQPGPATFFIDVKDKNGKPVDNATVLFDLNMTTMNMGTQQGNAVSLGNGRYSVTGSMSMRGPWRVRTTVTMPDGSVENKDFLVNVP
ncbi:MAG: FixH family protein [bacterium]|nr:FixH family protein [bacterium]